MGNKIWWYTNNLIHKTWQEKREVEKMCLISSSFIARGQNILFTDDKSNNSNVSKFNVFKSSTKVKEECNQRKLVMRTKDTKKCTNCIIAQNKQ